MSAARRLAASLGFLALTFALGSGQPAFSQQTETANPLVQPQGASAAAEAPAAGSAAATPPEVAVDDTASTVPAPVAPPEAPAPDSAAADPAEAGQAADPAADPALAAAMEAGHTEYLKNCRACHGSKGTAGVPLAGNYKVEGGFGYLGWAILTGPGYMPEFAEALTDEQIAQICTYILNSWGNSYGIVTAEDIASLR